MALHIKSFFPRPRIAVAAVLAVAATVAGLTCVTGPAAAALTGLYEEPLESAFDSTQSKTVVVACPTGSVIGGGATIFNGGGKVAVEAVIPDLTAGTLTVTAKETDPTPDLWSVTARAMCAPTPAGLVRVHQWTAQNSTATKTMGTSCPTGKTLLSVGWDIGNGWGEVLVNETNLIAAVGSPATGVMMSAREDDNYPDPWNLHTYLECADPIVGQQWVSGVTTTDSSSPKAVNATCPTGMNATGGAAMAVSMNAATQSELAVDSAFSLSVSGGTLNAFQSIAYEEDAMPDDSYLISYALCA
jgi:hypothetical protein